MSHIININVDQIMIPIENDVLINVEYVESPVAHTRRDCPNAPKKKTEDSPFPLYYYDQDFEKDIDAIYREAEATNAIQVDDGYFPLGARVLAGRKYYKTYSDSNLVRMKSLLLLVKHSIGWLRTNVQMLETENDENEWDIEFISE